MAYTIVKSDGTVLTTIADGTINTTNTSLGLPGRNYAGYGNVLDTNFVHLTENFANTSPPSNPLTGQLWYNTNANTLYVCPADGTSNALAWLALTSTSSGGATTFGSVTVTGSMQANNITATNSLTADAATFRLATISANANIANAAITSASIGTLTTRTITTGGASTTGNLTGVWTATGSGGNTLIVNGGNIYAATGIKVNPSNLYDLTGNVISFSGTYTNANVSDFLTGANTVTQFTGNIAPTKVTTSTLAGGGNVEGTWTLAAGARFQATYADVAERYAADAHYEVGTVVEIGGEHEVTAVKEELTDKVFGVVSNSYSYLLNTEAGTDETHPPIALVGRVTVKVIGKVYKGDRLVSAGNGIARAGKIDELTAFNTIGRSLVNKSDDGLGTVEATVVIK